MLGGMRTAAPRRSSTVSRARGVSGFAHDLPGAVDRLVAEQQLRPGLDIASGDASGPRLPNQVTPDQFHQAAHDLSDVRLGRSSLKVAPDARAAPEEADAFTNGAMVDIAAMLQTDTGRQEVSRLAHNDHTTTIEPNVFPASPRMLDDGAATLPDHPGRVVAHEDGTPRQGSDVQLYYNPGVEVKHSRSDVVLAHEARHAIDQTAGLLDNTPVDATDGVPPDRLLTREGEPVMRFEHQAVGLGRHRNQPLNENHYRDERRTIGQTADPEAVLPGDADMPSRPSYNKF
jgi:hypothetical protein